MKKHDLDRLFCYVAGGLFFLYVLCNLLHPKSDYSALENRALQTLPAFSAKAMHNRSWMADWESYCDDQLLFRSLLVKEKAKTEALLGKKENNGVYFGKDGFLLERPADWNSEMIENNLKAVQDFCALGRFSATVCMIPPAYEIKQEKLPSNAYQPFIPRFLTMMEHRLSAAEIPFVNPTQALWDRRSEYLYYRTDHHQTAKGSRIVYQCLADALDYRPLGDEAFDTTDVSHSFRGTTYSKALLPVKADSITQYKTDHPISLSFPDENQTFDSLYFSNRLKEKDQYSYFLDGNHPLAVIRNPEQTGRNIAVFEDSYGHSVAPFLAEHFASVHLIDLRYFRGDPLEYLIRNKIDQVLFLYGVSTFMTDASLKKLSVAAEDSPYAHFPDYGKVEETAPAQDTYFANALFVGDSLTVGFQNYADLPQAQYLCSTALSIGGLSSVDAPGGGSMMDQLLQTDAKKIYIMLGINEWIHPENKEVFLNKYQNLIQTVKQAHPDAYLYIQGMLPVSRSKDREGKMQNAVISDFNQSLEQLAKENQAYYLEVGQAVADSDGFLPEDSTVDGVHLKQEGYQKWLSYLKCHAVPDPDEITSVQNNVAPADSDYDTARIASELSACIHWRDEMGSVSFATLCQTHGIDPALAANGTGMLGGGATAEELTVIEAKSKEQLPALEQQLNDYVAGRIVSFSGYLPAETAKLKNAKIFKKGKLIFLVIADDPSPAQENVKKIVK